MGFNDFWTDHFSKHKPYRTKEGYKQVYRPNSPSARSNGYVSEHRYKAEKVYGPLGDNVVHHIDGNKRNNRYNNLQPLSRQEHYRLHNQQNYTKRSKRYDDDWDY